MFAIGSDYPEIIPKTAIIGDLKNKRFIRCFKKDYSEILYGKLKKILPYGEKFSTESSEIVSIEDAVYKFRGKLYSFFDNSFLETCIGKIVSKKEIATPKKCKYRMYIAIFYDIITQQISTKYLVEPV